ncbi:P-loop containing nucleoside triphosphate hydrolase protein [Sphaerosporella brunnea]|uniref:Kinesin-like protein n=1 Tax=Sphaerosporella brunnea TaxID=1250544 RepID=A0A5J5FB00_9PEZI|nr:P-loop containing nucleoside triphosphate hydrolase protein [Sphaerosporella brunnea]
MASGNPPRHTHLGHELAIPHHLLKSAASSASLRSREEGAFPSAPPSVNMPMNVETSMPSGNVRVVVRVRAFLPREYEKDSANLIEMNPVTQETHLNPPPPSALRGSRNKILDRKTFTFDNSFWSIDRDDPHYVDQEDVYNALGQEFLDHNFQGYHTCIFAYGQTGAGKSYTMMGTPEYPGLIPRTCRDLFERIKANQNPNVTFTVRVSYFEVYNEHVCDLLVPRRETPVYLKVRESPTEGPYIKDLTEVPVRSIGEVLNWMKLGDRSRTTASTNMNDTSSRSHAVFTLVLKQIEVCDGDETIERLARIRLVDLAGSERANSTGATGARLREGSNINKSLTTLGRVIAALADQAGRRPSGPNSKRDVIPYRDSILTWLLKDSLGGNSKTAMIACISPTDYDETLSTLRYADQAKRIRTRAVINQDQISQAERDAEIRNMQETIRMLQQSVSTASMTQEQQRTQSEQLELYQREVHNMQRMMEEAREVAECKIKSLQTQNEALRLHLRLAIESLKNPIPPVELHDGDSEYGSDDGEDEEPSELQTELRARLHELLGDLGMFRLNLADDVARFCPDAPRRDNAAVAC